MDVPNMPVVAYTVVSRVSYGTNYLIAGKDYLTPEYFVPATM